MTIKTCTKGILFGAGAAGLLAGMTHRKAKEREEKKELASALHKSLPDSMSEERKSIVIREIMKSASVNSIIKEAAEDVLFNITKQGEVNEDESFSEEVVSFAKAHPIATTWLATSTAAKGALAAAVMYKARNKKLSTQNIMEKIRGKK